MSSDLTYCLILDTHRGVYCGLVDWSTYSRAPTEWVLVTEFRHVFQFTTGTGVYQLATTGPNSGSRIGAVVPAVIIRDVSKVLPCSDAAAAKLRGAKWAT